MKLIVIAIVIVLFTIQSSATNYYLSGKGNDFQSGTSARAPWRSLKKLSEVAQWLQAGDSILLERGSVFIGELKISSSGKTGKEIYVGAYGSGAKPIISGVLEIKNWTLFRDNIWMADCIECITEPGNLFQDGKCQPLGRYPNEGYLTLSCNSKCKTTLTSNIAFTDGYWDGSEVVVKSSRWTLDNLLVSNYFNRTFYFSTEASYTLQNGFGFFIQKHLATLDKPGEWFFDTNSKRIFLYCKNGDKPSNHTIDVSITDVGLGMLNANFVTIENLNFKDQKMSGAHIAYSNNIMIRNCAIEYSGVNGMEIVSCQNPIVENCRIENSNNNGVEWKDNSNGSFVRNFIQRTGLHPGRGKSGNGTYIGLIITADNPQLGSNLFQYNSIDSTGYSGIDFRTGSTSIKNNMVSNFCRIKDDGAGIYTWGNSSGANLIEGNIVVHGVGCGAGTNDPDQVWVHGIYIDDRSTDINVNNNTIAYCGTDGVFIHNAKRISIQGNTLFGNGSHLTNKETSQLSVKLDNLVSGNEKNLELRVIENRFVALQEGNHCISIRDEKEGGVATPGLFDRNYYCAPKANQVFAKFNTHQDICDAVEEFKLSDWQRCTENDRNSQFKLLDVAKNESKGSNLIRNGGMTASTEGWIAWPSQVFIVHDKKKGKDGPSLKVQFPSGKLDALLYHAGFNLNNNKTYRLSFSAMGTEKSKIEFAPLMASSPWEALDDYACFSIDSAFKSFTYTFKPNKSSREARVNFKSNATFWIDNVTLSEVASKSKPEGESLQLIYNATEKPKTIPLSGNFTDLEGKQISSAVTLQEYSSIILLKHP